MNWNTTIRQWHRWLGIAFTATVVITVVGLTAGGPEWLSYIPLFPLALLFLAGLYLLVRTPSPRTGRTRRIHRWSAIVFIVAVLATIVALSLPDPIVRVSYIPLLPLAALLGTGLYMFLRWARKSQVTA
ncbi:hypothetical protein [Nocardia sp. NPDC127526]|uniref:hypothetical protein n=1 Tax=Nocardia sp. NPDC127526 TaxID=3345393 RepID=UPI003624D857